MARFGYPGIYLIATNAFDINNHREYGFDALSEFPPHQSTAPNIEHTLGVSKFRTGGRVRSYATTVALEKVKPSLEGVVHPGVMPAWDNSPRQPASGQIYHGSTPALFADWLRHAVERAGQHPAGEQLVFINAWNEWAEGAYLEPDLRFGYGYLEACAAAVRENAESGSATEIRADPVL